MFQVATVELEGAEVWQVMEELEGVQGKGKSTLGTTWGVRRRKRSLGGGIVPGIGAEGVGAVGAGAVTSGF